MSPHEGPTPEIDDSRDIQSRPYAGAAYLYEFLMRERNFQCPGVSTSVAEPNERRTEKMNVTWTNRLPSRRRRLRDERRGGSCRSVVPQRPSPCFPGERARREGFALSRDEDLTAARASNCSSTSRRAPLVRPACARNGSDFQELSGSSSCASRTARLAHTARWPRRSGARATRRKWRRVRREPGPAGGPLPQGGGADGSLRATLAAYPQGGSAGLRGEPEAPLRVDPVGRARARRTTCYHEGNRREGGIDWSCIYRDFDEQGYAKTPRFYQRTMRRC